MKDPSDLHYQDDYGDCVFDDEEWPCKTWHRWAKTKDYRIQVLEERVESLARGHSSQYKQVSELQEKVHILETYFQGTWPLLNDVAREIGAQLVVNHHREYEDITLTEGPPLRRLASKETTVEYQDQDGSRYENGRLVEKVHPKP